MHTPIDSFVPQFDLRKRHETVAYAPASIVMEVARNFDLESISLVRWTFWLRAKLLRALATLARPTALISNMTELGWGVLAEEPGKYLLAGAFCQPWEGNVAFQPIPPERFASFAEPGQVKIVWTLEVESLGPNLTRLATETRVRATDDAARAKFRSYWRMFSPGILMIRRLILRAVRRQAESSWRATCSLWRGHALLD